MAGRKTKLTPAVIAMLAEGIEAGMPYEMACYQAGISERTFGYWRAGCFPKSVPEELQNLFLRTIKRAEAQAAYEALVVIKAASLGTAPPGASWQAAAWFLEHRYPEHFRRRSASHS